MNENNNKKIGVCFMDLLTIAFIILKLCKVITWSWFWILSPIIIIISIVATFTINIILEIKKRKKYW